MDKIIFWKLVFLFAILFLDGILARPQFSMDNSQPFPKSNIYWQESTDQSNDELHDFISSNKNQGYFDDTDRRFDKRGFSILARWRPFNLISKHRTTIRDINRSHVPLSEYDIVSAETRAYARPSGQPLRWG